MTSFNTEKFFMEKKKFDAIVIGAGPGGYPCAIRLAQLGKKVAIIEKENVGGVCLNVGCIPSKAMIKAASFFEKMQKADGMGFKVKGVDVDFKGLQEWKRSVVTKLTGGVGQLLKGNKVEIFQGDASFVSKNEIAVKSQAGAQSLTADHIVIAVGSSPIELPNFKFDEKNIISSTGALDIDKPVSSMVVVGGGYIGLEIGTYMAKLGTSVTVLEAMPRLLASYDQDVANVVGRSLKKRNVNVLANAVAKGVKESKGGMLSVEVEVEGKPQTLQCEKVLVTVGRRPNAMPGIEKTGVQVDAKGFIKVNDQLKTNVPGIYAIGDVAGQPMLAHKATKEGLVVADVIAGKKTKYDVKAMPAVIFCEPEVATVGLSEQEAKAKGIQAFSGSFPFAALGKAIASGETDGFTKLIGDKKTGRLIGAAIVGPEASTMIAEMALALEAGLQLEDVALTVHAHPTMGEATMEAAEVALGHAIHVINRAATGSH